jgi:hypothetical protein
MQRNIGKRPWRARIELSSSDLKWDAQPSEPGLIHQDHEVNLLVLRTLHSPYERLIFPYMELDKDLLERTLRALGEVLESRGHQYELVVIGGSALLLLDLGVRPTKDLDVVAAVKDQRYVTADPLPAPLAQAVVDVGATFGLTDNWLNPEPASLLDFGLPEGFEHRTQTRSYGGLILHIASREDQICFKLYAATDQGPDSKHVADLMRLSPGEEELLEAARWATSQDPSPGFRKILINALKHLGVRDAESKI